MRIRLTSGFNKIITVLAAVLLLAGSAEAAGGIKNLFKGGSEKEEEVAEVDIFDLSLEDNIYQPEVGKNADLIADYQLNQARDLKKKGYAVELMRQGEVIVLTIPAGQLFAPNDTVLMKSASKDLKNFLPYFRTPGKFKIVLAVHTDDTGNDSYLRSLSEKRIVALYDYFDTHAANTELLTGYPMGANDPLTDNANRAARAANRRLEIYILPADRLIEEASTAR